MEGYASAHAHNDYTISSQSRIEVNLCFRGPPPGQGNYPGDLQYSHAQPTSMGAPLWLQPGPWLNQCASLTPVSLAEDEDMPEVVQRLLRTHQQNLICGNMESEEPEPIQDPLEHQPTFSFEPPGSIRANQAGRNNSMASVASVEIKSELDSEHVMPSQPLSVPRIRRSPRTEYNDTTMKDFRQHLGVIDLRNELVGWPYQNESTPGYQVRASDLNYQQQLIMLEQQNQARLEMAKKGQ